MLWFDVHLSNWKLNNIIYKMFSNRNYLKHGVPVWRHLNDSSKEDGMIWGWSDIKEKKVD